MQVAPDKKEAGALRRQQPFLRPGRKNIDTGIGGPDRFGPAGLNGIDDKIQPVLAADPPDGFPNRFYNR